MVWAYPPTREARMTDQLPAPWVQAPPEAPTDADIDAWREAPGNVITAAQVWHITDLADAEWAMARLADAQARLQAISDQAAEWMDRITEWARQAGRRDEATADYMAGKLQAWALGQRAADPKAKTFQLPSGTVATRHDKPAVEVDNPAEVSIWASLNLDQPGQVVEQRPHVHVAELRKVVTVTERLTGWLVTHPDGTTTDLPERDVLDGQGKPLVGDVVNGKPVAAVEPLTELVAVDAHGRQVPGVHVRADRYTATVTPRRPELRP